MARPRPQPLHRSRAKHISACITDWFHVPDTEGFSVAETLRQTLNTFFEDCRQFKLSLGISESHMRRSLCEALCTMRYARITHTDWRGPYVHFRKPPQWTAELDALWIDFIHTHCVSESYWTRFWAAVPYTTLDRDVPDWRANLQYLLPLYLYCDIDRLVEFGILYEEEDGNVGAWESYEPTEEEYSWI